MSAPTKTPPRSPYASDAPKQSPPVNPSLPDEFVTEAIALARRGWSDEDIARELRCELSVIVQELLEISDEHAVLIFKRRTARKLAVLIGEKW